MSLRLSVLGLVIVFYEAWRGHMLRYGFVSSLVSFAFVIFKEMKYIPRWEYSVLDFYFSHVYGQINHIGA